MSRLKRLLSWMKAAYDTLISTLVGVGVVWLVFCLTREATVLNNHLATIEAKMIDHSKPIEVTIEPYQTLGNALKEAPKKGKHK